MWKGGGRDPSGEMRWDVLLSAGLAALSEDHNVDKSR
jgi:predicted secreted protein